MAKLTCTIKLDTKAFRQGMQNAAKMLKQWAITASALELTETHITVIRAFFEPYDIHFYAAGSKQITMIWKGNEVRVAMCGKYLYLDDELVPMDAANFDQLFKQAIKTVKRKIRGRK